MAPFEAICMDGDVDLLYVGDEVGERKTTRSRVDSDDNRESDSQIQTKVERSARPGRRVMRITEGEELEFQEGDHVFVKVSPMRNVIRFGRKGKLSTQICWTFSDFGSSGDF